jgi:hypothetical protein
MEKKYYEEDGFKRNWLRFKDDVKALKAMPDGQPADWLRKPWDMHAYIDMYKESCQAAPYLMGHIWAVYFPVSLITIVVLLCV